VNDRFGTAEELGTRVAQVAAGDPQSTRVVYALVISLIVVGLLLVFLAVWMIRRTRADLELLGPLERMGDSKWRKRDPQLQQALLDDVRPAGAVRPIPATASISPVPGAVAAAVEFPPPAVTVPAVVEPTAERSADVPAEPGVELAGETTIDALVEADPDPLAESDVPVVEPVVESDVEPVVKPDDDPVVVSDPEPVVEPDPEPVVESDPEPVVATDPEAIAEPAVEG
jgi:hypothetical protein